VLKGTALLTRAAVLCALGAALLLAGGLLPTARISLAALSALTALFASAQGGIKTGLAVFAATGALSLLLPTPRGCVFMYLLFFGWYSALWPFLSSFKSRAAGWAVKLLCFNAALLAFFFLGEKLLSLSVPQGWPAAAAAAAANVVFYFYDRVLWSAWIFYHERIRKKNG
jgi:hypothetical protein